MHEYLVLIFHYIAFYIFIIQTNRSTAFQMMDLEKYLPILDYCQEYPESVAWLSEITVSSNVNEDDDKFLKSALEQNILISCNEGYKHASETVYQFFWAAQYLAQNCDIYSEESLKKFVSGKLLKSDEELSRALGGGVYICLFILILNRIYGVNMSRVISELQGKRSFFGVYYAEVLEYIVGDDNDLAEALILSTPDIKASSNYISIHEAVRSATAKKPTLGFAIISKCDDFRKQEMFVPDAFYGITFHSGMEVSRSIIDDFKSRNTEESLRIVVGCIRKLAIDKCLLEANENSILNILDSISRSVSDVLNGDMVVAYGNCSVFSKKSRQRIDDLRRNYYSDNVILKFTFVLYFTEKHLFNDEWFVASLKSLNDLNLLPTESYHHIGHILFEYIKRNNTDFVYNYLEKFFLSKNFNKENVKGLQNFIANVLSLDIGRSLMLLWITRWFCGDHDHHHIAASEVCVILEECKIDYLELDVNFLDTLSINDVSFALHKVLGYVLVKNQLESLVFSFTNYKGGTNTAINNLVIKAFCEYIVYNYKSTLDYLIALKPASSDIQRQIISIIEDYYEKILEPKSDPPLELGPSMERLAILMNKYRKDFSGDSKKRKFDQPSFLDDIKTIDVKLGCGFFSRGSTVSETLNYFEQNGKMQHFSTSMEIPIELITDPIQWHYQRILWRRLKKQER